jgi:hypothetical protein
MKANVIKVICSCGKSEKRIVDINQIDITADSIVCNYCGGNNVVIEMCGEITYQDPIIDFTT